MPHCSLTIQRRMRPEFAALLLDIYPELKNGKEVESNLPPSCIEKSMFFWDHKDPEEGNSNYSNIQEAERTVRLALFLMQQLGLFIRANYHTGRIIKAKLQQFDNNCALNRNFILIFSTKVLKIKLNKMTRKSAKGML